ncbi:MAG: GerMN domain-containing protein [Thermodesulfobacteriota bacterium]|nr:GerMN domain-containing protein [Thermodesulfobacteriota bacterium]
MGKRRKKKGSIGKFVIFLFLIGIVASVSILFRKEIADSFRPLLEKLNLVEERKEIVLYFSDRDGEYLIGEKRKIAKRGEVKEEAKETINELIKGPKGKLTPTLPSRTRCLNLKVNEKGVAIINFNKALSKDHPGGSSSEILTTYSIVNSLTLNFPRIKEVQILIEGKPVETITGHLSLKQPISSKPDLIKK